MKTFRIYHIETYPDRIVLWGKDKELTVIRHDDMNATAFFRKSPPLTAKIPPRGRGIDVAEIPTGKSAFGIDVSPNIAF